MKINLRKAILPALILIVAIFFNLRSSYANKEIVPFLGKWSGRFVVDRIAKGLDTQKDRDRSTLEGFIQIYATNRSFKMHLEGEQETLDLGGFWTMKGDRVTLQANDFQLDDQGGADLRDPNRKYIPAEALHAAYEKPLVFVLSKDKKKLTGLLTSIGDLIGRHELVKDSF